MADHLITGVVVQCGWLACGHVFTATLYPTGAAECPQCRHRTTPNLDRGLAVRLPIAPLQVPKKGP